MKARNISAKTRMTIVRNVKAEMQKRRLIWATATKLCDRHDRINESVEHVEKAYNHLFGNQDCNTDLSVLSTQEKIDRINDIKKVINEKFGGTKNYLEVLTFAKNNIDPNNPLSAEEFLSNWHLQSIFNDTMKVTVDDIEKGYLKECQFFDVLRHPLTREAVITQAACDHVKDATEPKPFGKALDTQS